VAGAKIWFSAYGKKDSDPVGLLKTFSGKTAVEIDNDTIALGGRRTLFDYGIDDFFLHLPFTRIAFEFPEWGPLQRNFVNNLLAELLNKALDDGTDIAFQFNPLREDGDR